MRQEEFLKLERKVEEVNDWRHRPENAYTRAGRALVSKVTTEGRDLNAAVKMAVDAIGGVRHALQPQDRVLLKANFNSDDPFPASTDIGFLTAVVELLRSEGITNLTLGERSGWPWLPTKKVMKVMGVLEALKDLDLPFIDFDPGPWMDVRLGEQARRWKTVAYHQSLKGFDKIVYLPCMKHHFLATFTMSLKLTVGLTHPVDMQYMHADHDQGKVDEPMYLKMIELSLPVGPDLIIMDGRKSFVTGGPDNGELVEPNVILASGDRIALDVEGVKILQSYPRDNLIKTPVWEMPIIRRAIELGLGARSETDYQVVTE
jgi:uncharacterized protein (DUF362 family)